MSNTVRGVVVAHGSVAEALIAAAERITGTEGALVGLSNDGLGAEALRDRVRELATPGPAIIFVDLAAGSCAMAGLGLNRMEPEVGVVTGVSLPMLVDFVFNASLDLESLIERIAEKGRSGITAHGCDSEAGSPAAGTG